MKENVTSTKANRETESEQGSRLADFAIRFPVTVCMVLFSMLLMGAVSMTRIPLVLLPDINEPNINVIVPYPNSTPEQIQETITRPLEEALSTLPHVDRITSQSDSDQAIIRLLFPWGEDIEVLRSEVRERVEQVRAQLPEDVDRILVQNFNTSDIPVIEGRIASGRDLRGSYDFLDLKIKKPLERVAGVAEVEIGGVERKEIDIYLRLDDIKRYGVDVDRLFRRLDSANLNLSLGQVQDGGSRFSVVSKGTMDTLQAIRNFPVNGLGLRLQDVADVVLREPAPAYGRHLNGEYAISLQIRKSSDANTVETVNRVMARIEEMNEDPSLQGIEVLVWHNSGKEITRSLSGLLNAGLVGAFLSVGVLFFFLRRLGATLLIGTAIPFSIVAAVGFLYLLGNSLNVLSMMGLMLSTGMLVDNAVVVLESIYRHLEKGEERMRAARIGTTEVVTAVVAATLTSVIIFVPLVFGRETNLSVFLGHTGAAIMITLLCSLFISLSLIPLGAARFLKTISNRTEGRRNRFFLFLFRRLKRKGKREGNTPAFSATREHPSAVQQTPLASWTRRYIQIVDWTLLHRLPLGLLLIPALIAVSFVVLSRLPDSSPDAQEMRDLSIQYEFSENYHYARIEKDFVGPVEKFLFANRDQFKIKDVYSYYANNEAQTRLYFDQESLAAGELTAIRKQIAEGLPVIPGAEISMGRQEGANQNWIGVNLYGEDPTRLMELAREARKRLLRTGRFAEVHTALERGQQEVQLVLDRQLASRYGISPQSVSNILDIVLRGRKLRGYRTSEGEIEIWTRLQPGDREDLRDLETLVVGAGKDGRQILLSHVADLRVVKAAGSIQRENRRTYTEIWSNFSGDKKDEGKQQITEIMNEMAFPPGFGWSYGFWTRRESQEDREFAFNLLLALFMVYFVMASLFESLAHPFAIMISLLFAFVGVAWFLLLTGTPFNIMAQIGIMILIGIVVNNGIVLIDHINNLRRKGLPRSVAVREGCRERFRPILMTASTTVVGLIPLAVGTSGIFELRYFPMARTLMGGLIASTVLTLVVLPTYYTLIDDLSCGWKRLWQAAGSAKSTDSVSAGTPQPAAARE